MAKGLNLDGTYVDVEVSGLHKISDKDWSRSDECIIAQLATIHASPETAFLKESAANIWWGGESKDVRALKFQRKQSNGVNCFDIAINGPEALVFRQENNNGKLVRYWLNRDTNLTARVRYVNTPSHACSWYLEVYRNVRVGNKWRGTKLVEHYVHRTVTEESELTVSKYVAIYFTRFAA